MTSDHYATPSTHFAPHVEVYRRREDQAQWGYTIYGSGPEEEVMLESVGVAVSLAEIYEGINFDEPLMEE